MKAWNLALIIAICAMSVSAAQKKLIEFGWDEPGTGFMREHAAEMEKTPFDGCVFHVEYKDDKGAKGSFTWQGWGERKFSEADVKGAIEDLKATQFKKFTNNFLRFNTTPAKLDWFDDHAEVTANARLAAVIAREGKCPGLLFDIEQYEGNLFDYRKQRVDRFAALVHPLGRQLVVHVVVHTGITASASPPALSTITPP